MRSLCERELNVRPDLGPVVVANAPESLGALSVRGVFVGAQIALMFWRSRRNLTPAG